MAHYRRLLPVDNTIEFINQGETGVIQKPSSQSSSLSLRTTCCARVKTTFRPSRRAEWSSGKFPTLADEFFTSPVSEVTVTARHASSPCTTKIERLVLPCLTVFEKVPQAVAVDQKEANFSRLIRGWTTI